MGSTREAHFKAQDDDKDQWESASKRDHVLVRFSKPQGLAANIQGDKDYGTVYEVPELLVPTTLATADSPLARVCAKYVAFGKCDPSPIVLLRERWGIGMPADR